MSLPLFYFRLLWSPFSLANIVRRCSTGSAAVVGLTILYLEIALVLSSETAADTEPFPSFGSYIWGLFFLILMAWILLAVICTPLVLFCVAEIRVGKSLWKYANSRISKTKLCIFFLG